ncbi:MAG: LacI family DNA-binding transcriptional regulator [Candidatus Saccharibacteria bacterium]|nr:LacI family DNA-binding transcriptional regulator [Microbacteriaceae bacterium]
MRTPSGSHPSITRLDVARHAGVSTAVVSYVVNSGPRNVSPATRARVLESINSLGYRPNAAARALRRGVSEIIGLVLSDNANPYFAEFSSAIEKAAAEQGLSVIFANSALIPSKERDEVQKLVSRQVDGLLLASTDDVPNLSSATAANVRVVLLDRSEPMPGFASIGVDFRQASRTAVEHLIGHGHRRIGLISGGPGGLTTEAREQGWEDALTAAGLPRGPVVRGEWGRNGGYRSGIELLGNPDRPTAIFAISDLLAIGLLRALHEAGIDVPQSMAVASFDGSSESEFSWPPLTAVRQPVDEMARAAISALGRSDGAKKEHRSFTAELIVRQSCGCLPG